MPQRSDDSTAKMIRTLGALSAVGFAFVLAIVIGAGFGYLLDRWLGTGYVFFLIFFFFGLAAGILNVFRTAARFTDDRK
jgi:ATP synthase protein I